MVTLVVQVRLASLKSQLRHPDNRGVTAMVDRRREPRTHNQLSVRVWGIDGAGRAFDDHTCARDISLRGALLEGLEHPLRPGDLVGVQHGDKKARFRVVWVRKDALGETRRAAVQRLLEDECPWSSELSEKGRQEIGPVKSASPLPRAPASSPGTDSRFFV